MAVDLRSAPGDRLPVASAERQLQPRGERQVDLRCPSCAGSGLQELGFGLANGDGVQLRRCSRCEWKTWYRNDQPVALVDLLEAVTREGMRPARRGGGQR